jgi:hypothetical protein
MIIYSLGSRYHFLSLIVVMTVHSYLYLLLMMTARWLMYLLTIKSQMIMKTINLNFLFIFLLFLGFNFYCRSFFLLPPYFLSRFAYFLWFQRKMGSLLLYDHFHNIYNILNRVVLDHQGVMLKVLLLSYCIFKLQLGTFYLLRIKIEFSLNKLTQKRFCFLP